MNAVINSVKPLVYYFKAKAYNTFDTVFKIHTKLTVYLLLICSILSSYTFIIILNGRSTRCLFISFFFLNFAVSGHSFNGKPIDCIVDDHNKKALIDMICWINGTYTKPGGTYHEDQSLTWTSYTNFLLSFIFSGQSA